MKRIYIYSITCATITAFFFLLFPEVDLYFTKIFYDKGFAYRNSNFPVLIYKLVKLLSTITAVSLITLLIANIALKKNYFLPTKKVIFLILCMALGPGLVVNTVFKDNWGRARPAQILEFGGDKTFTSAFIISDQCERNCSFVSGHASIGYFFSAFAYVFPQFNLLLYFGGIALGLFFGLMRIMQGQHFLSDVIFSGVFVLFVTHMIYLFMFKIKKKIT